MKVVLIDDEILALDFLERRLDKIPAVELANKFTNPLLALEFIKEEEVNLIFLDINMPEINGLMLAKKIRKIKPEIKIVFVTAYDHYAAEAFELNVEDYIVKPVRLRRLKEIISRLKAH